MSPEVSFGKAVKAARHEVGLSQEALAYEAGIHRTYISDIERGRRNPSLTTMIRIAEALEQPVAALVSFHVLGEQRSTQRET